MKVITYEATALLAFLTGASAPVIANPFEGKTLYHGHLTACEYSGELTDDENEARDFLCAQPTAVWVGDWELWASAPTDAIKILIADAKRDHTYPVIVVYNIPRRDCGLYASQKTEVAADEYLEWVHSIARGIGDSEVAIIVEPDALAHTITERGCFTKSGAGSVEERYNLIRETVSILKERPGAAVYIDAGSPEWVPARLMASLLVYMDIEYADGFALNIASRADTRSAIQYGRRISKHTGGKGFIIDTSRNGYGQTKDWCNPDDEALGDLPTTNTGNPLVHAFLWIKIPGESDGECGKDHPPAGTFWPQKLLNLYWNSKYAK